MLKEVRQKIKMLQANNRAQLVQQTTAEFQQRDQGVSDDELEGG